MGIALGRTNFRGHRTLDCLGRQPTLSIPWKHSSLYKFGLFRTCFDTPLEIDSCPRQHRREDHQEPACIEATAPYLVSVYGLDRSQSLDKSVRNTNHGRQNWQYGASEGIWLDRHHRLQPKPACSLPSAEQLDGLPSREMLRFAPKKQCARGSMYFHRQLLCGLQCQ